MERYEISRLIGEGSFGKVFVGRERASDRIVAMKHISKAGRQEKEIKSLRQECDIQRNLHHPNIIQMLDSYETDDGIVVVTELAHGDLIKVDMKRKEQGLPGLNVQKIACDLVSALYFLHSRRILHRDIKPQNVLIGMDGNAKLCDFGFAKTMDLNTYMLTSLKGTPLYMAPEIVQENLYDHNADLWSLGCILYELWTGRPPFYAKTVFELACKLKTDQVHWDPRITGNCLSFLQGLLEKNPKKRLTWPALLSHPYVCGNLFIDNSVDEKALTKVLSPSQEFAKECERRQKRLQSYSKLMAKTYKKYENALHKLHCWSADGRLGTHPLIPGENPPQPATSPLQEDAEESNTTSSCETMTTSSSDSDSEGTEESDTSPSNRSKKRPSRKHSSVETCIDKFNLKSSQNADSVQILASSNPSESRAILFTLHPRGSTDSPINTDEWLYFLMNTMKEVLDNPNNLCQKQFLNLVVPPLKNQCTEPEVVDRIAALLSLPFAMDNLGQDGVAGLVSNLLRSYTETKVLPHLLFACKLIVINRCKGMSVTFEEIGELLTEADLEGLEKCLRLVIFLVHIDEEFATQFCGCICSLNVTGVLKLFLKLGDKRPCLAADTVSALSQLLRTFPKNTGIIEAVEDILLDKNENAIQPGKENELWRLISHENPLIQSRSLRVFTYLSLNSERVKAQLFDRQRSHVWNILNRAVISSDADLRKTAVFALQALNFKSSYNGKSQSSFSGAGEHYQNMSQNISEPSSTSSTGGMKEKKIELVLGTDMDSVTNPDLLQSQFSKCSLLDRESDQANDSSR